MSTPTRRVWLGRRLPTDEGFTILETMVALGAILAAVVALAYVTTAGFSHLDYARQRQTGSGLANEAMEQVRGLPFDTLKQGLGNTDLAAKTDPNIVISGPDYLFRGEKIPHGDNATVEPLVPHQQTTNDAGATTYTVSTYVTYYQNDLTSNTFRVTVLVSWTARGTSLPTSVETQSIFYSGSGCLSTDTHPFAAPCQPFFFSSAANSEGLISITGSLDGGLLQEAKLSLPSQSSDLQIEQTSSVQGASSTGGARLTLIGQAEQLVGGQISTSGADNDPGQPGQEFETASLAPQSAQTVQAIGNAGLSLNVTSSGGDTGSTTSTTSASISPSNPCPDLSGLDETDALPCGNSNGTQGSAETATLDVFASNKKVGLATLVSLGAPSTSSIAYTDRAVVPVGTVCPTTTGEGCVHSAVTRSWGSTTFGGLPDGLDPGVVPPGWGGYLVAVDNATGSASSEAGIGSGSPQASVSGTVSIWNGIGYTQVSLTSASVPLVVVPVHVQETINNKLLTIDISASLSTGGTTIDDPAACITPCDRTSVSTTVNSPITGTITYTVVYDTTTIASLTIQVDLGYVLAKNTYEPSPSSG